MKIILPFYYLAILLLLACSGQPESSQSRGAGDVNQSADAVSEIADTAPDQTEIEGIDKPVIKSGQLALNSRTAMLQIASISWLLNNSGISETELAKVSEKGFLPFWIRGPITGNPIRIKREQTPSGHEIAYWPVPGTGKPV